VRIWTVTGYGGFQFPSRSRRPFGTGKCRKPPTIQQSETQHRVKERKADMTEAMQSPVAKEAVEKIIALRKLSRESGCITTRTQSKILQTLSEADLTIVAQLLAAQTEADRG
jgi:hypothetical protein